MRKKTIHRLEAAAALGAIAAGGIAVRQLKRTVRQGWGRSTPYGKLFDPTQQQTIAGEVLRISRFVPAPGMGEGIELLLQTSEGPLAVHLAPSKFLPLDGLEINPGDDIEVSGPIVEWRSQRFLMASAVQKGDLRKILRNELGTPLWRKSLLGQS